MTKTKLVHVLEEDYDVYIGRKNLYYGLEQSIFANPFPIRNNSDKERRRVIEAYRKYFYHRINSDPYFKSEVEKLFGKTLACWCHRRCHPKPCHGNVIIEYLEKRTPYRLP